MGRPRKLDAHFLRYTDTLSRRRILTHALPPIVLKPQSPEHSSIVIFGAGAVGMAAVFAAAAIKIKTIIIVDLVDNRLELAKSLGATHSINGKDTGVCC